MVVMNEIEATSHLDYLRKAIEIVKLNRITMSQIAKDEKATWMGIIITGISGALVFISGSDLSEIILGAAYSVVAIFAFAGLVHIMSVYSMNTKEFMGFFRVNALAGILDWACVIPVIGWIVSLWGIPIAIVSAEEVYGLTRKRSTVIVLVSVLILWVITFAIFTGPLSQDNQILLGY